jgi:hypothetical protein
MDRYRTKIPTADRRSRSTRSGDQEHPVKEAGGAQKKKQAMILNLLAPTCHLSYRLSHLISQDGGCADGIHSHRPLAITCTPYMIRNKITPHDTATDLAAITPCDPRHQNPRSDDITQDRLCSACQDRRHRQSNIVWFPKVEVIQDLKYYVKRYYIIWS